MAPRGFLSSSLKSTTSTTTRKPYAEKGVKIKVLSKFTIFKYFNIIFLLIYLFN